MFRFIHSADWQLGARFGQFGLQGMRLHAARLETLRQTLEFALNCKADAFLIAGDLFEDILDDVLVNTDPVRQERILDVLGAQAARLQILIPTCHRTDTAV
jgi:hypothetical protein